MNIDGVLLPNAVGTIFGLHQRLKEQRQINTFYQKQRNNAFILKPKYVHFRLPVFYHSPRGEALVEPQRREKFKDFTNLILLSILLSQITMNKDLV